MRKRRAIEGKHVFNRYGDEAIVLGYVEPKTPKERAKVKLKFLESTYVVVCSLRTMDNGGFIDYTKPRFYGVGISPKDASKEHKQEHRTWVRMLERCYSDNHENYNYYKGKGVTVCERWLNFENFLEDLPKLENYKEYKSGYNSTGGNEYSLDKDIGGGRIYSPDSCMFLNKKQQRRAQKRITPVRSISTDGTTKDFECIADACKELGVQNANVYKVLNGERDNTKGYRFERL